MAQEGSEFWQQSLVSGAFHDNKTAVNVAQLARHSLGSAPTPAGIKHLHVGVSENRGP